jgi:translation initiation factor IF-2
VKADAAAQRMAADEGIEMHFYSIIYNVIEDVEKKLAGMLEPKFEEHADGHAEVRQVFKVGKNDVIFGCYVTDGNIVRNTSARVMRGANVIFTGKVNSLRRFKDDVREVASGYECGISLDNVTDVQPGDIIETFSMVQV